MPRHRHKPEEATFPVSRPSQTPPPQKAETPNFDPNELDRLVMSGNSNAALEILNQAPKWMQRTPEHALMHASLLMQMGDMDESGRILREAEKKYPTFIPLYLTLADWYITHKWPAHALRVIRKVFASKEYLPEMEKEAGEIRAAATDMLKWLSVELDLPLEKAEQASWFNEAAQLAMAERKPAEVERHTREALKIAPHWHSPRNNYAHALYFQGKREQAISESKLVIEAGPNNIHALNNLVIFYVGLEQKEQAAPYIERLAALSNGFDPAAEEMDIIIFALALAGEDERLWEIGQPYLRKKSETLHERSWQCLAVNAARLGHLKEAKKFIRHLDDGRPIVQELKEDIEESIRQKKNNIAWPPIYPGIELYMNESTLKEWVALVKKVEDNAPTPSQKRKIDDFMRRHPYMAHVFKLLLWSKSGNPLGVNALAALGDPAADAEILRFGLSDIGDNDSRMHALTALQQSGRYNQSGPIRFWDDKQGDWREVSLNTQMIGDVDYKLKPQVVDLLNKSLKSKDPQESMRLLRKAIELDPTCPIPYFNLGVVLKNSGQEAEGDRYIRKSVEVDPDYTFGWANLAYGEALEGNADTALNYLMKVSQSKAIALETAVIANIAYCEIHIRQENLEMAHRHLDLARQFNQDHRLVEQYTQRLKEIEVFSKTHNWLLNFQKNSARRLHRKLLNTPLTPDTTLTACLDSLTNDLLTGMARHIGIQAYGKKEVRIKNLAAALRDKETIAKILEELTPKEREALAWTLSTGGWQPWKEFTRRYGDDFDQSPYWNYQEPQSIPGRLRRAGVLFAGTLDSQQVAFIPSDLRPLLKRIIN